MSEDLRRMAEEVDRLLHEPSRLLIATILYTVAKADFTYLLRETGLTKGNLSAHLAKLEEAGYVAVEKGFAGKIPRTTCSLTERGREAYRAYREHLRRTVAKMPR
ncbi:MAG: winged helix-turn-helix domain-containing protein [Patescibacteria group bacterium]